MDLLKWYFKYFKFFTFVWLLMLGVAIYAYVRLVDGADEVDRLTRAVIRKQDEKVELARQEWLEQERQRLLEVQKVQIERDRAFLGDSSNAQPAAPH